VLSMAVTTRLKNASSKETLVFITLKEVVEDECQRQSHEAYGGPLSSYALRGLLMITWISRRGASGRKLR
jgi:hypothetical protein